MTTLAEDIEAQARQLFELCKKHGLKHVGQSLVVDPVNGESQLTLNIEHPLGRIKAAKTSGYFNLPEDFGQLRHEIACGIKALGNQYQSIYNANKLTVVKASANIDDCREKIRVISMLDPTVLDQIVISLEETG